MTAKEFKFEKDGFEATDFELPRRRIPDEMAMQQCGLCSCILVCQNSCTAACICDCTDGCNVNCCGDDGMLVNFYPANHPTPFTQAYQWPAERDLAIDGALTKAWPQ